MINIQDNIEEISIGNISMGSVYVGNLLVWQKVLEPFIEFIDENLEYLCCTKWGKYKKETITTVVSENDDVVNITTVTVPYTAGVAGTSTTVNTTRQKTAEDVVGTTTVTNNIMVGTKVSDIQSIIGNKAAILHKLRFIYFTSDFDKTIPIYGLKSYNKTKQVDCYLNFDSDNGSDYIRLAVYHQYWGYVNGGSGYTGVTNKTNGWYPSMDGTYVTLFKDTRSKAIINQYVTFRSINGYRPAGWKSGLNEILVSIDDVPLE